MPALTDSPSNYTVLVTGANGFVASWIVGILLKRGYTVHGTVRSQARGATLLETYKAYADDGKLKLVIVEDMEKDGAWDEAVKGVDAILHTAAKMGITAVEPKDQIEPTVKGVTGILASAFKYGTSVKRLVCTSTCAAVVETTPTVVSVSESDWNEKSVKACEELGGDAGGVAIYSASKTLAEKALWDWYEKHKTEVAWDVAVINPPWIFGPSAHSVKSLDDIALAPQAWYNAVVKGDFMGGSSLNYPSHGWVDVRDTAEAHVLALEVPKAGGERIITCGGSPFVWQDFVDTANSLSPSPYPTVTKGMTGETFRGITFATSKAKDILGMKFRTMEELTRDSLEECARAGI
ncbi:d-lactaldehyde dehydrogenase [Moniliophthora roreri MCA 2997]|uniref:D-lactaldehyde dehydrogenase n=1 Tax=Moniliophthora roreri (strain MCA 2997) TaxID=1381753 RepID=V2XTY6_MONRO|nr:d-lactaldehyde dehydrogenase [Moniliophthora roreri MCA 2997]